MTDFSALPVYFAAYSVLGWICETIFCSFLAKKFVNRGFLAGPYCPIYGFGALIILVFLQPLMEYPPLLFITAVASCTLLEYVTSWAMEKMFRIRWWDYSDKRFNIQGRVCLGNSLIFGALGLCVTYGIHPYLSRLVDNIPGRYSTALSSLIAAVFVIDSIITLNSLFNLDEKLQKLKNKFETVEMYNERYSWFDMKDLKASLTKLEEICRTSGDGELLDSVEKIQSLAKKKNPVKRLISAFPHMRHTAFEEQLAILKEKLMEKANEARESLWKLLKSWTSKTAAKVGRDVKSMAGELSFYKLFWVFFISSIIGYIVETLFCLVTLGYIESRQGLLYGPFSQVYGLGAVIMVIFLKRLEKRGDIWIFAGSALVGGLFEYACSFLQELIFGTISWQYAAETYSIGERTSLLYMCFWGVLGVFLIKVLYPAISRFADRLQKRPGTIVTWVLLLFMCINISLSAVAVARWSARSSGAGAQNAVDELLDRHYPDSFMEEVYPNMKLAGG